VEFDCFGVGVYDGELWHGGGLLFGFFERKHSYHWFSVGVELELGEDS
jgi:hypothetical protein